MNKTKIQINEAKKKDILSILKLAMEMANFHHKIDKFYKSSCKEYKKDYKKWLLKIFNKRNSKILIAKKGKRIIGYGIASIKKSKEYSIIDKIGKINQIFIEKKFRRKGIGKEILKRFLEWFNSKNIKYVQLNVDARNKGAINFYKKFGFEELQKIMMKKINKVK